MNTKKLRVHDQSRCDLSAYRIKAVGGKYTCDVCRCTKGTRIRIMQHLDTHSKVELEMAGFCDKILRKQTA